MLKLNYLAREVTESTCLQSTLAGLTDGHHNVQSFVSERDLNSHGPTCVTCPEFTEPFIQHTLQLILKRTNFRIKNITNIYCEKY